MLSALWSLMSTNNMMEGRDRRQVKCSPELKNLFGVEAMSLSSLRQRVADHLTPSKAIQIEYSVTNTSFVPTSRYEASLFSMLCYNHGIFMGGGKKMSYHIISYHIISHYIISYRIISHHIISSHIISYHIKSCCFLVFAVPFCSISSPSSLSLNNYVCQLWT